jgi:hypothetical protein
MLQYIISIIKNYNSDLNFLYGLYLMTQNEKQHCDNGIQDFVLLISVVINRSVYPINDYDDQ